MSSTQQIISPELHQITTTSTAPLVAGQPQARESMSSAGDDSHLQPQHPQPQEHEEPRTVDQNGGKGRRWSSGLMQFGKDGFPWKNLFCPCAGYLLNKGRIEQLPNSDYKPYRGEDAQIPSLRDLKEMSLQFTTGCCIGFEVLQRRALRDRLGIPGSALQDLALTCCCMPCSQAQQRRELEHELGTTRNQSWDEKHKERV